MRQAAWNADPALISLLLSTQDQYLNNTLAAHLVPTLKHVSHEDPQTVGRLAVALARTIYHLYVPDTPLDPNVAHLCRESYWKNELSMVHNAIHINSMARTLATGDNHSLVVDLYQSQEVLVGTTLKQYKQAQFTAHRTLCDSTRYLLKSITLALRFWVGKG
jgi:hypothetical protein